MMLNLRESRMPLALLVVLAAFTVYANSLANGFALDDVFIVEQNARVHDIWNLRGIWLTPYWPFYGQELGLYRPVVIFMFAVQWAVGGGAPWVFHVVNCALHVLVSVFVFLFLDRVTLRVPALVGALIFAVHPVHTEAVANVVGQAELFSAAATMGACLLYMARPSGAAVSWPRMAIIGLLYLAALGTKENAIVLPALLVLCDCLQHRAVVARGGLAAYSRTMAMPMFLLAAVLCTYLLVRLDVMTGAVAGLDAAPAMPYLREEYRVLNALRVFPEFLRLLFFPADLSSDYMPAVILPVDDIRPMVVFGAAMLAGVVGVAVLTPWLPRLGFAAAWFLVTMLTVLNLFFPIGVLIAERTLYLPSVAVSVAVAFLWGAMTPHASPGLRRLVPLLVVLGLSALSARTWTRNPDWKNTTAVWDAVYRDHPESYRANWARAAFMSSAGRHDVARAHYELAFTLYSRDSQLNAQYANVMMGSGEYDVAIPLVEEAYRKHPFFANTGLILAFGYVATGRYPDALKVLREIETLPTAPIGAIMGLRAYAYRGLARHDAAAGATAVAVRRGSAGGWADYTFLARALARAGDIERADSAFARARELASDSAASARITLAERAMAEGCYRSDRATDLSSGFAGHSGPACDPLDDWLRFPAPVQNATHLQNAKIYRSDEASNKQE